MTEIPVGGRRAEGTAETRSRLGGSTRMVLLCKGDSPMEATAI